MVLPEVRERLMFVLVVAGGLVCGCSESGGVPQEIGAGQRCELSDSRQTVRADHIRAWEQRQPRLFAAPQNVRPVALFQSPPIEAPEAASAVPAEFGGVRRLQRLPPIVAEAASSPRELLRRLPPLDSPSKPVINEGRLSSRSRALRRLPPVDSRDEWSVLKNDLDPPAAESVSEPSPQRKSGESLFPAPSPGQFALSEALQPALDAAQAEADNATAPPADPAARQVVDGELRARRIRAEAAMAAVADRANQFTRRGVSLAERGAYYSARAEFIQALSAIAQARDAIEGQSHHSKALAAGLRALKEADDFAPRDGQLDADLDLASMIASHRTPVLKSAAETDLTSLVALQQYFTFAQEQLAEACGNEPAGSMALFGLGKLHSALAEQAAGAERLHDPKAIAMHQAALAVDARNHKSANELGVLLARYGRLPDARRALLHSVSIEPTASAWRNLAAVHRRMGEVELAQRAANQWSLLTRENQGRQQVDARPAVQWVNLNEFARAAPSPPAQRLPGAQPAASAVPPSRPPGAARRSPWSTR